MPRGDGQRVWFPEMLAELRATWSRAMTWEQLAEFCSRMTARRSEIRRERGIQSPLLRCRCCGEVSRAAPVRISIRSALFALRKEGLVTQDEFDELDRSWKKHRASCGLDANGVVPESRPADCLHHPTRGDGA